MKLVHVLSMALIFYSNSVIAQTDQLENRVIQLMTPYAKERGLQGINIIKTTDYPDNFGSMDIKENFIEIAVGSEVKKIHAELNEDVFAYVLCHEMGHFFAGAPLYNNDLHISSEGQSDYWAAAVCLKKLFRTYPVVYNKITDPFIKSNCDAQYASQAEQIICYRIAEAGFDFMTSMHLSIAKHSPIEAKGFYRQPDFKQKENYFSDGYPTLQCRAETVAAGAFCNTSEKRWGLRISDWACETALAERPSCWFKK